MMCMMMTMMIMMLIRVKLTFVNSRKVYKTTYVCGVVEKCKRRKMYMVEKCKGHGEKVGFYTLK
jgi:hypothetical protein